MNSGTYMVPVTVTEEQKKYISQKYPDKELQEALQMLITECITSKTAYSPNDSNGLLK